MECKEVQPVHPKWDQSWLFTGMTDAEAEIPILCPPHVKSWLHDPMEKEMATHSSILAWRSSRTEDPGRLQSMEFQIVYMLLKIVFAYILGFSGGSDGRICLQCGRLKFDPWVGKIPWRIAWLSTPIFLPGEFHGQRSLVCWVRLQRVRHDWATNTTAGIWGKIMNMNGRIY